MRKIPTKPDGTIITPPEEIMFDPYKKDEQGSATLIRQQRMYELITPLFGGGVKPSEPDPVTVIRGTEVRGQLRFWWRATRGGQFGTGQPGLQKMKMIEDVIWGAASTAKNPRPSYVQIAVDSGSGEAPVLYRDLDQDIKYAAFPLQKGRRSVLPGVTFTLKVSFPRQIEFFDEQDHEQLLDNVADEVEAALWAWETFGGIGARTRRGFGALRLKSKDNGAPFSFAPQASSPVEVRKVIEDGLDTHLVDGGWPNDVPHLSRNIFCYRVTEIVTDKCMAWKKVIGELKRFRQQRPGRRRSKWPEPDAIRTLTKQWLKAGIKHPTHPGHPPDPKNSGKFPRAAFGLPIVFHFIDIDEDNPRNPDKDPRDVVLKLASHDRLASPLILRPLCLSEGRYIGLAILLEGSLEPKDFYASDTDLILGENDNSKAPPIASGRKAELTKIEATAIKEVSSGNPLLGDETDPLIAFLNRIQKENE